MSKFKAATEAAEAAAKESAQTAVKEGAQAVAKEGAEKSMMGKFVDALSAPQRKLSKLAAEAAGLKAQDESAANFASLADLIGDKMGVPRDSTIGNAVKAAGVAGAEVFADPLGMVPFGKIAKGAKGLKSAMVGADKLADALKLAGLTDKISDGAKVAAEGGNVVKSISKTLTGDKWSRSAGDLAASNAAARPVSNIVSMADKLKDSRNLKVKADAKTFAKKSIEAELEKQPGLINSPDYLKNRMQELANFFFAQKRSK